MQSITRVLPPLLAMLMLFALPYDAEAKRLGFGKSMGRQYSVPAQRTPAAPPQNAGAAPRSAAPATGAGRWLGPLAGLAAGGLLAALLFGDAFQGLQVMDLLLMAALVFGGIMLFRAMRGAAPRPAGGPPLGGGYAPQPGFGPAHQEGRTITAPDIPDWFTPAGFAEGAKVHFIRLQAAWDKGDMQDIAEYTTPELFAELQAERLSEGASGHFTEVLTLDSEFVGAQREGDRLVASIRFSGLIREGRDEEAHDFAEIWHVVHAWETAEGDWLVAGIQQQ